MKQYNASPTDTVATDNPSVSHLAEPAEAAPVASTNTIPTATSQTQGHVVVGSEPLKIFGISAAMFRNLFIKCLLGLLVAAAIVAVISVLAGGMDSTAWRSIWTIGAAILHISIVFGVISISNMEQNASRRLSTSIVSNATVAIAVMSFFTAVLHIWDVLWPDIAGKLYSTYFVLFVGLLYAKVIMDAEAQYNKLRPYAYANYGFIALAVALVVGVIFNGWEAAGELYSRLLTVSVIISATLGIIVAVLLKLHIQKHPEIYKNTPGTHTSVVRIILILLVFFVFVLPLLQFLLGMIYLYRR